MTVELYHGDCLDILPTLAAGSVELLLADPPYFSIVKNKWDNQWKSIHEWGKWCGQWGSYSVDMLTDNGSAYIFGDDKNIAYMQIELDKLEWGLINNIVWSKTNYTGLKANPESLRSYRIQAEERILFYGRDISFPSFSEIRNPKAAQPMAAYLRSERHRAGVSMKEITALFPSKTGGLTGCVANWELGHNFPLPEQYQKIREYLNKKGEYEYLRSEYEDLRSEYEDLRRPFSGYKFTDVWSGKNQNGTNKLHPTQKPEWIIKRIIESSSSPGDTILDPFMGSGTTGVACVKTGRNFIGIELDKGYYEIAKNRIAEAQLQPRLFTDEPTKPQPENLRMEL